MAFLVEYGIIVERLVLGGMLLVLLLLPAWWLAGRLQEERTVPFFRFLCSLGLALVGYLTFVNLLGRLLEQSILALWLYIGLNSVTSLVIVRNWPNEASFSSLLCSWRDWWWLVLMAFMLGLPQGMLAVSTPYLDEVASSAIHLTAANQFAEGLFPPRHNALPDVAIKYHYAFMLLSGGVKWVTGLSANHSIDIASTGLWLFTFLFSVQWLRNLGLGGAPALWGGASALLGGGLAWLYLPRIEAYQAFWITPGESDLLHRYDGSLSFLINLLKSAKVPSAYLRNADGSLSNLPWDIVAQFQQHPVAVGIALTVFALYLLVAWYRSNRLRCTRLIVTVLTYAVLFLCHAVFGGVAAVTAGVTLLALWLRKPSRRGFFEGLAFGLGVGSCALLHGGFLAFGTQYGLSSDFLTLREVFGYSRGGLSGFLHWNLAGFGLPLLLALVAWEISLSRRLAAWRRPKTLPHPELSSTELAFFVLTVFTLFSYSVPQCAYYSSASSRVEQQTEISKFFFTAHLGLALLSAFGVANLLQRWRWCTLAPVGAAMAVTPLVYAVVNSTTALFDDATPDWKGFYFAPYGRQSVEQQMGEKLLSLKRSNREQYFDASADERTHNYLGELLIFGGSVFTLTPSRYERTGSGYRLSQEVVADRFRQNSRMARLHPGAAEQSGVTWLYSRPTQDWAFAPLIVRARFEKMYAEHYLEPKLTLAARSLYAIQRPTADLDKDILRYWHPRIVAQAKTDWDGDGRDDLIFFDYVKQQILIGKLVIDTPVWVRGDFPLLYVGQFPGDHRVDFHLGHLQDTEFRFGGSMGEVVERTSWGWSYLASTSAAWNPEYQRWGWIDDIPLVADLDGDGYDSHLMYRPGAAEWYAAPALKLAGPTMDKNQQPLPFAGRFLPGSSGDLGLWAHTTAAFVVQSLADGRRVEFKWGSAYPTDVFVPADYDGDGQDEIGLWNHNNQFWYWRKPPDGPITQFRFGTPTAVPVPADYNHDGRVDPAYWEPGEGKIYVTFTVGAAADLVLEVPPNAIPAFVNML